MRQTQLGFHDAFLHASIGMALVSLDGIFLEVNDELCRMLGRPATELVGTCTLDVTHPDDIEATRWSATRLFDDKVDVHRMHKRYMRSDGEAVQAILLARVVRGEDGEPAFLYAQIVDITSRHARYSALAELGQRALTKTPPDELFDAAADMLVALLDLDPRRAAVALHRAPEVWTALSPEDRDFVQSVINVLDAATARLRAEDETRRLAMCDGLTGLPNRTLLTERIGDALGNIRAGHDSVCLLMLDLDGFKRVNDSLGHTHGDGLLRDVAQRLVGAVRPSDTVSRLGGDEFAVLLKDITAPEEAEAVAQRLLSALKPPFAAAGRAVHLSASIGIARARSRSVEVEDLLADADLAMYSAKTSGKGRQVAFAPHLRKAAAGRLALEEDLRDAVTRGAFQLHYQPIVDLVSGRWVGAEGLVRWPHATRGLVPPLNFIPLAEDTGLVVPLGEWIFEQAVSQLAAWRATPGIAREFSVAVNVSVRQIGEPGFADTVKRVIEASGMPPCAIVMEMTESVFMADDDANLRVLRSLHDLGVRISIDDFGTGYSSLSYLRRFPIDVMKLDRSFVAGLIASPEDRAVTRAVIDLAHNLELELVAEGIEREEQLQLLRQLGCRLGQGYYLQRPAEVDRITEALLAS